ncbi:BTAD domain-containing putative transcriptional regulator [Lentzea sp. NPDC059081]|uniref:AfsR/SARP family transcriptional regulator n=1 Tax=Lentzea sp. NPDC059081 TaxID=3346719 RepID=UPI003676D82D
MGVWFRLLGGVEAGVGDEVADLGPARQRCVLAVLLVQAGQPVPLDRLADRVWGAAAPAGAPGTLRSYLSKLRTALPDGDGFALRRGPAGYVLDVDAGQVDLGRFRRLVAEAGEADDKTAAELYRQAFGVWTGEPFAGVETPWLLDVREALLAERRAAVLDHHDVLLRLGRHSEVVGPSTALAAEHPLDERIAGQLITALHGSGRQADALGHYERVRRELADELGADPGVALRHLHQRVLAADEGPRQLPQATSAFTGREAQLAVLDAALDACDPNGPPLVVAVHGPGGAGKTTLALHWAHRVRGRFPDGQVHLDLRGFGPGEPMDPALALDIVLRAVGVPAARIPRAAQERSALLRTTLTGRRVLLFLDNARDAGQVRPLLPGTGCAVLVTSRNELRGLAVSDGARRLDLGVLDRAEAVALVAGIVGGDRVEAAREAVADLVELCGRLPLALVVAAQQAATLATTPLADLVADLTARHDRLDLLSTPDDPAIDPRAVFSWSYRGLPSDVACAFRYLGLHPAPEIGLAAASALLRAEPAATRRLLEQLVSVHLLERDQLGRYRFHDLLQVYAAERAAEEEDPDDLAAATRRILDWYLHALLRAKTVAFTPTTVQVGPPAEDVPRPPDFADAHAAKSWYRAHRTTLLAVLEHAADRGFDTHGWQLAYLLQAFHEPERHLDDLVRAAELGLRCARRTGDDTAMIHSTHLQGSAFSSLGRYEEARAWQRESLAISKRVGDDAMASIAMVTFGLTFLYAGQVAESAEWLHRALAAARRSGSAVQVAHVLLNLAALEGMSGRPAESLACSQEALELYREIGTAYYEGFVLGNIAEAELDLGKVPDALEHVDAAIALLDPVADQIALPESLLVKGRIHLGLEEPAAARQALLRALELFRSTGNPRSAEVLDLLAAAG